MLNASPLIQNISEPQLMKKPFSYGIKLSKNNHGRPRLLNQLVIPTIFMATCVFSMPLRDLQGFINSVFTLT
ncbi:hypothetical protein BTN50_0322 [Candidatus Enterovibrio altilux]|uniref:Transposase DDE domain-containing protein n=1 Tax=Candidatus Enterovibrio altilux TaxID=1927128 RepID=A0A291B776_9GAMM|nr:hypothetical protein BTN50_0322 [Candidatus Enterovibrio luxaltus]